MRDIEILIKDKTNDTFWKIEYTIDKPSSLVQPDMMARLVGNAIRNLLFPEHHANQIKKLIEEEKRIFGEQ